MTVEKLNQSTINILERIAPYVAIAALSSIAIAQCSRTLEREECSNEGILTEQECNERYPGIDITPLF